MTSLGNKSERGSILREREANILAGGGVMGSGCGKWNCLLALVNPREGSQTSYRERDHRLCFSLKGGSHF